MRMGRRAGRRRAGPARRLAKPDLSRRDRDNVERVGEDVGTLEAVLEREREGAVLHLGPKRARPVEVRLHVLEVGVVGVVLLLDPGAAGAAELVVEEVAKLA